VTTTRTAPSLSTGGSAPASEKKPTSLVVGVQLARAMSALGAVALVGGVVALTIRRYSVSGTGLNFAGPAFAFLMLVLLALAVVACLGVRAASRTLRDDTGARDVLFGFGVGGAIVTALVAIKMFVTGGTVGTIGGVIAVVWFVATIVALVMMSSRDASQWLEGRAPIHNVIGWIRTNIIAFIGVLVMAFLYIPNIVVAAMSFNHEVGKHTTYQWYSFSLSNWGHICAPEGMCGAVKLSIGIGFVATIVATTLGTLAAFALTRHRFSGRSATNTILFLPMATPDIVMGSSLLAFFVAIGVGGHLGKITIVIAHVMFCLSYVVVTVKARLSGMDSTLQEAAMDLYADEKQTFWRVTFPLVLPGILAAGLLAFSLSFDDYIITNLNAGTTTTFPIFVWGAALRGLPMQVNVIGTIMFVAAILIVLVADLLGRSRQKGKAA
jgi:spermidine/putrescine transport system permease protein